MRRPVLIHHHLFKNAGTTLDGALSRSFAGAFIELMPAHRTGRVLPSHLADYLREHSHIRCVSSHNFLASMIDEGVDGMFFDDFPLVHALLIRHPIARLLSINSFYRANPIDGPLPALAKTASVRDFFLHLMNHRPGDSVNNQLTSLGLCGRFLPQTEEDLALAVNRLSRLSLVGTVERFDETMACAEYFLSPVFPGIDLCSTPLNVTAKAFLSDEAAILDGARENVGGDVLDQLMVMNEMDVRLWRAASAEMERRTRLIPDWQGKRAAYLRRCDTAIATAPDWQRIAWPQNKM